MKKKDRPAPPEITEAEIRKMSSDEALARLNSDPGFYRVLRKYSPLYLERDSKGYYQVFVNKLENNGAVELGFRRFAATRNQQLMESAPPKVAELVLLLLPIRQREHLLGDLEEEFRTVTVPRYGRKLATILYIWQVGIELARAAITGLSGVALGWIVSRFSK